MGRVSQSSHTVRAVSLAFGKEGKGAEQVSSTWPLPVMSIDAVHQMVHLGWLFEATLFNQAVANAKTLDLLVRTGINAPHTRFHVQANGSCRVMLYEAPTFSAPGTAVPLVNRNRHSENVASFAVTSGPTVSAPGVLVTQGLLTGGELPGNKLVGSAFNSFEEVILRPETAYLFRVQNISGQPTAALASILGYEPPAY